MHNFETVAAITEWWKANANEKTMGVLFHGQRREVQKCSHGWIVGFPDKRYATGEMFTRLNLETGGRNA